MDNASHLNFMKRAIELSKIKMTQGFGGPFGAIITKDDQIISEGYNQVTSKNDPTAHAEVTAIREACQKIESFSLKGYRLYTSCEPCPMCLSAIYWARIDEVYFCNTREEAAAIGFDDEFIYKEIPLNIHDRKLKMQKIPLKEASDVFKLWQNKSDKIAY